MPGNNFLRELKGRHVYRVAVAYAVVGWLLIEIATQVFPVFHIPDWASQLVVLLIAIGFPIAVVLAWAFEMTPDGVRRTEPVDSPAARAPEHAHRVGKHLNSIIIGVLALAVAILLWRQFAPRAPEATPTAATPATTQPGSGTPTATAAETDHSIAVLPFVNMSSDKEQDYFSDGLSEELLNQLAKVPQLRVIARTSSFSFKDKEVDVATIAKTLNVANILEGSVRKNGDTLRITAQLIRAADSSHMWSKTYDRKMTDIFKVQDEISSDVVDALKLKLLPAQQPSGLQRTSNPEAYKLYLFGQDIERRGDFPRAVTAYRQAIALDPGYANAYVALYNAQAIVADAAASPEQRDESIKSIFAAIEKAISLAPDMAQAYAARGRHRFNRTWDWQGAREDLERGYALDPNSVLLLQFYSGFLFHVDQRQAEAIAMSRKATELDPLSDQAWVNLGALFQAAGNSGEADIAFQRALKLSPTARWANFLLGYDELKADKIESALVHFRNNDQRGFLLAGVALAEYTRGNARESQQALDELKASYAAGYGFQIAAVHAWRGEKDQAMDWLERAYQQHDTGMLRLRDDPTVASLHDHPRFAALVKKMDFPE